MNQHRREENIGWFSLTFFGFGVGVYRTCRSILTIVAFPALFLGCVTCFSFTMPELKAILDLARDPRRVICKFIFTYQWLILLKFISAPQKRNSWKKKLRKLFVLIGRIRYGQKRQYHANCACVKDTFNSP